MKIAIIGYSGSGKSTLAKRLGELYGASVLHLDTVHFLPKWEERTNEDECKIVTEFLDANESWVIDGSYSKIVYERRMQEADKIILLLFNRFICFHRVVKRYKTYKGKSRESIAQGCEEKLDFAFAKWVIWDGRLKKRRKKFERVLQKFPDKTVVCKNQRQVDKLLAKWQEEFKKTP